jgi:hypothetical protein
LAPGLLVGCASAQEVYDMGVDWLAQNHWYEPRPELKDGMYFLDPAVQKVEEYQSKNNVDDQRAISDNLKLKNGLLFNLDRKKATRVCSVADSIDTSLIPKALQ